MADFLVFQLYGPMASWGDIAVGEYRPSFAHPTKSAIIGLLAAALGIRRDEDDRQRALADACSYAVRVDSMGVLLRDYHTTQVPPARRGVSYYTRASELGSADLNTILSSRDYRCDAAYTVAINVRDNAVYSAQVLVDALLKPAFTLYLGRKSCPPALPLHPKVVSAANLKEALESISVNPDQLTGLLESSQVGIYWEDDEESGYNPDHVITRRDQPLSRERWQFSERRENYTGIRKED